MTTQTEIAMNVNRIEQTVSELPADKHRTDRKAADNITYTQAGVSCFVGQENDKFKVQFFAGSSVVKIPACV